MIDRVVLLFGRRLRGAEVYQYEELMLFAIPAHLKKTVNEIIVVPTPSETLPEEVLSYGILSAETLAALDSGDAIFELDTIKTHGQSEGAVAQHIVSNVYPKKRIKALENYVVRWSRFGRKVL